MIRNSRKYRRLKAQRDARKARNKNLQARALDDDEKKKDDEIVYKRVAYKVPSDVPISSITLGENLTDTELMSVIDSIQDKERHVKEEDPSDQYIHFDLTPPPYVSISKDDLYPDGWSYPYFPAGKRGVRGKKDGSKPRLDMIVQWVEDVKLAGKSQKALEEEYMRVFNVEKVGQWTNNKYDNLKESIAYLVSRKIWYVGRKSSGMTDEQWDELTKDMRPPEGSFSANEKWVNGFPYGREYTYNSGAKDYY